MRVLRLLVNFVAQKVLNTEINTSGTYLVFAYNASAHLTQVQTLNFVESLKEYVKEKEKYSEKLSKVFLSKSATNAKKGRTLMKFGF